jgi:hypothetical protein
MASCVELPKLPEGQDSFAGIPKAEFVVCIAFYRIPNCSNPKLETNDP